MAYRVKTTRNPWEKADMKNGMLTDELIHNTYPANASPFAAKNISHTTYSITPLKLRSRNPLRKFRVE